MRRELDRLLDDALGADPRLAIVAARKLRQEFAWIEQRAVQMARTAGYDWGRIGRLLGVSRQSARSRFVDRMPTLPPHKRGENRSPQEGERSRIIATANRIREDHYLESIGDDIVGW